MVFIGVYAAFALQSCQVNRQRARQAAVLRERIAMDLDRIAAEGHDFDEGMGQLRAYIDAIASGERPTLTVVKVFVPYTPEVWDAVLASGGLELLETDQVVAADGLHRMATDIPAFVRQAGSLACALRANVRW